jgi:cell division transport system permease protein
MPTGAGSLRSLTATMTVMCYLACLAIGALLLINRAVDAWTSGLAREMTVQIRQVQGSQIDAEVEKAAALLREHAGIAGVEVLDREAGIKLLEPWLGSKGLDELPIPRLIKVLIDEEAPPDTGKLEAALTEHIKGARLDTHKRWQSELTRMARSLTVLSSAVLALICLSAVTMVIFGTRTVLDANREIVDVLHLVGATDGYISRQIDVRFLRTGLYAGLIGVGLGLLTFLLLGLSAPRDSGGVADASRSLIFAPPELAFTSYSLLLSVPLVATFISLITSRMTLTRMLRGVL